jgi:hypothetical protein
VTFTGISPTMCGKEIFGGNFSPVCKVLREIHTLFRKERRILLTTRYGSFSM